MFCPKCGQSLPDDAAFCFRCGQPMQQVSDALGQGVPHTQNQQAQMPKAQNPYVAQNQQQSPPGYSPVGNRMSSGPMTTPWGSTSVWQQPMPKQQQAAVPPQGYAPPQQPNPAPPQVEELSEQNRNHLQSGILPVRTFLEIHRPARSAAAIPHTKSYHWHHNPSFSRVFDSAVPTAGDISSYYGSCNG